MLGGKLNGGDFDKFGLVIESKDGLVSVSDLKRSELGGSVRVFNFNQEVHKGIGEVSGGYISSISSTKKLCSVFDPELIKPGMLVGLINSKFGQLRSSLFMTSKILGNVVYPLGKNSLPVFKSVIKNISEYINYKSLSECF
jgi:hypothetical protein